MAKSVEIKCPECGWKPDGQPHWQCSCGYIWDTFQTAGRCPACSKQWERTACIPSAGGCTAFPLHLDWYDGLDEWLREELERIRQGAPA